jgi:dolichol-phosphate mannosyltransferase
MQESSSSAPELTAVIMAFNEVANLEPVVREILASLSALRVSYELLVIDDGSTDGTGPLADRLAQEHEGVRVHHHHVNAGLGGVYRTGFREARGRYLTFFPADGQFPASIIEAFLPLMAECDLVLGYLPERRPSRVGRGLSAIERLLYRGLFGPMPRFQGIMMIRTEVLRRFTLKSAGRGWAVLMELILRVARAGFRIRSVPTPVRPRLSGHSKVNNLRTVWSNFQQALELRGLLRS